MASIINRSNYVVSVRSRDDLTRTFPYDKQQGAKEYYAQLRAQQFRPRVEQLEDTIFVRVRDKGYKAQTATFDSLEKAETFLKQLELDRAKGLDCDYTAVANATIDRELDLISSICTIATKVWKYNVPSNPMNGVRRPKYFNERDRRLKKDEDERLLAAAIAEDTIETVTWRGLRCNVVVAGAGAGMRVDIRTKAALVESSLAASIKAIDHGKASLAVVGDDREGTAALIVVVDENGEVVQKQATTIGEN